MWEEVRIDGRGWKGEEGCVFFVIKHCEEVSLPASIFQKKNLLALRKEKEFTQLMSAQSVKLIGLGFPDAISDSYQEQESFPPIAKHPVTQNYAWFDLPPRANGDDWCCLQDKSSQEGLRSQGGGGVFLSCLAAIFHISQLSVECVCYFNIQGVLKSWLLTLINTLNHFIRHPRRLLQRSTDRIAIINYWDEREKQETKTKGRGGFRLQAGKEEQRQTLDGN